MALRYGAGQNRRFRTGQYSYRSTTKRQRDRSRSFQERRAQQYRERGRGERRFQQGQYGQRARGKRRRLQRGQYGQRFKYQGKAKLRRQAREFQERKAGPEWIWNPANPIPLGTQLQMDPNVPPLYQGFNPYTGLPAVQPQQPTMATGGRQGGRLATGAYGARYQYPGQVPPTETRSLGLYSGRRRFSEGQYGSRFGYMVPYQEPGYTEPPGGDYGDYPYGGYAGYPYGGYGGYGGGSYVQPGRYPAQRLAQQRGARAAGMRPPQAGYQNMQYAPRWMQNLINWNI